MSKKDAIDALLFGSYIASIPLGDTRVVPDLSGTHLSPTEINDAAKDLISREFISPIELITKDDPFRCAYEITPKGKNALGDLQNSAALGLFNIVIATGGSRVVIRDEKHQTITITSFEQSMIKQIDNSNATKEQKDAAKSKLQEFLTHPLLGTVLGAAVGALLKSS